MLTYAMAHLAPRQDTQYGAAGILHWSGSSEEAHCLMRLTFKTGSPVVVLSELMSSPKGVMPEVSPVANAAYSVINGRINRPTDITWLIHLGPFSTADTLWSPDVESFSQISLTWSGERFEAEALSDHKGLPFSDPFPKTLGLAPVEDVLRQLSWRNWRDEW